MLKAVLMDIHAVLLRGFWPVLFRPSVVLKCGLLVLLSWNIQFQPGISHQEERAPPLTKDDALPSKRMKAQTEATSTGGSPAIVASYL